MPLFAISVCLDRPTHCFRPLADLFVRLRNCAPRMGFDRVRGIHFDREDSWTTKFCLLMTTP